MTNPSGFTDELRKICRDTCGAMGEPPCWKLPDMISPCEQITPCPQCLTKAGPKTKGGYND